MRWHVEDIDFSRIDIAQAAANEDMLLLLCAASFVESGSDLYSSNLAEFFEGDGAVCAWLCNEWEAEELQHGQALRAYIKTVWPDFDWDAAFDSFFKEYSLTCSHEQFEKTKTLELVARCVIETGTSSLYRAVSTCSTEPVLTELAQRIHADEVHHYKYFLRYFKQYNEVDRHGRLGVLGALMRRVLEVRNEDEEIAMRHVLAARYPEHAGDADFVARRMARVRSIVMDSLPVDMGMKMLIKPLNLPNVFQRGLSFAAIKMAKLLAWRRSAANRRMSQAA